MFNKFKFTKNNKSRFRLSSKTRAGFTLVEFLIVIAIIAILSTVVMINLQTYIRKSKEAAIKGNMNSIVSSSVSFFDREGRWDNVFVAANNPTAANALNAVNSLSIKNATINLKTDNSSWCACADFVEGTGTGSNAAGYSSYCVDSTGYKSETEDYCSARCGSTSGLCTDT